MKLTVKPKPVKAGKVHPQDVAWATEFIGCYGVADCLRLVAFLMGERRVPIHHIQALQIAAAKVGTPSRLEIHPDDKAWQARRMAWGVPNILRAMLASVREWELSTTQQECVHALSTALGTVQEPT